MSLVSWDKDCSVGVEEIDNQHKKLFETINKLYDLVVNERGNDVVGDVLNDLTNYIEVHFKTEEDYFKKFNYPDASLHKYEHQVFIEKVLTFKKGFEMRAISLHTAILSFLMDWVVNHILVSDKKYIDCFNSRGLK